MSDQTQTYLLGTRERPFVVEGSSPSPGSPLSAFPSAKRPYLAKGTLPRPPLICSGYRCKFLEQRDTSSGRRNFRGNSYSSGRTRRPPSGSAFGNYEVSWIRIRRGESRGTDGGWLWDKVYTRFPGDSRATAFLMKDGN